MTNRSRYFATRQMRKTGTKEKRPEQMLAKELIEEYGLGITFIDTEYLVKGIKVVDHIDLTGERTPKLDIVVFTADQKIGIRVNGKWHDSRSLKDRTQKSVLEHPLNGWKIVDFWYWKMETLFKHYKSSRQLVYKIKILQEINSELEGILKLNFSSIDHGVQTKDTQKNETLPKLRSSSIFDIN